MTQKQYVSSFKSAQLYFNKGKALQNRCQWRSAIPEYTKALQLNPEFVDAYLSRGLCYEVEGMLNKAIRDYTRAIKLDPKSSEAYESRAQYHSQINNDAQAIQGYSKALTFDPRNAWLYWGRAQVYAGKRLYAKATQDYRRAIRLEPKFADSYFYNIVRVDWRIGNFQKAISDFTRPFQGSRDDGYYNQRGHLSMTVGNYDEAINDYSTAIKLDPKKAYDLNGRVIGRRPANGFYYLNRARAYQHKGEYQKAMQDITKAFFAEPMSDRRHEYTYRGFLHFDLRNYENALRDFHSACNEYLKWKRRDPYVGRNPLTYLGLAITCFRTGKRYKAKTFLKTAVRLARKSRTTIRELSKDYFLTKPALQAIRELQKAF